MIITECKLEMHDNLYFATREMGRFYETTPVIHNYALTYALGNNGADNGFPRSNYACPEQIPQYKNDLKDLDFYVTPAKVENFNFDFNTFKFGEENNYLTSTVGPEQKRKLGISDGNKPSFGRVKEIGPGSTFSFIIISTKELILPKWIRLGKWMSKASLKVVKQETTKEV